MHEARLLLQHVNGMSHAQLAAHPERRLDAMQQSAYERLVARRATGEPVAYLTARCGFYGREFRVTPAVLIPRPETELLVDAALDLLKDRISPRVLDLGTGSGVLALTIALERPDAYVIAVDLSPEALEVARANAVALKAAVRLLQGEWFGPLAGERFDLIVANPPYVAAQDEHLRQGDLRFEPASALTDGSADGLASLRAIVAAAPTHLAPGGALAVEHGYDQGPQVVELFRLAGFAVAQSLADLAGLPRVVAGLLNRPVDPRA
jgi:release factor glutamine methyltransferase